MAEVRQVIFQRDLQKVLFPDNSFYKYSVQDAGSEVLTIEIPQELDGLPSIITNVQIDYDNPANNNTEASSLKVFKSINTKKTYSNETFIQQPRAFDPYGQDGELSYDKVAAVRNNMAMHLNNDVANWALTQWTPTNTDRILLTSGTGTRATEVIGSARTVKKVTFEDIIAAKTALLQQNQGSFGGQIYALLSPQIWSDMIQIPQFHEYRITGRADVLGNGDIYNMFDINFIVPRASFNGGNILYNFPLAGAPSKLNYGNVTVDGRTHKVQTATADTVTGILFWNSSLVRRSEGAVKVFVGSNDPQYQSDVISSKLRFGATLSREDQRGVIALVENVTA